MKIGKEEIIAYVKIPIEDKYIIYPIVKFNPEMDSMELIIFYTARIEIKLFEKEGKSIHF